MRVNPITDTAKSAADRKQRESTRRKTSKQVQKLNELTEVSEDSFSRLVTYNRKGQYVYGDWQGTDLASQSCALGAFKEKLIVR